MDSNELNFPTGTIIHTKKPFMTLDELLGKISHLNKHKESGGHTINNDKTIKMNDCGWSLPNKKVLDEISLFVGQDIVLEVAAGLGLWSLAMKLYPINVITTSLMTTHHTIDHIEKVWTDIEIINAVDAIKKYSEQINCLFLSWGRGVLSDILNHYKGNKLIIVCEYVINLGGSTDMLFEEDEKKYGFKLVNSFDVKGKYNFHDKICFYKRKS